MNKLLAMLVLGLSFLTGCDQVPAGYVGVKVYMLGGPKGVDSEVLGTGRYMIGMNEQLFLFPLFKQNYTWTASLDDDQHDESISFQTKEGMQVNADIGITYSIDREKVPVVFQTYRRGVAEITDTFLRNNVRDAFSEVSSTMAVESVYGEGKAELMKRVLEKVRGTVAPIGILVDDIYLVNSIRLPDNVVKALNSKIEATQRAQQRENELREAEAESKKTVAIAEGAAAALLTTAKAQAESNSILSKSLTPELVELKRIEKWNGVTPTVMGSNSSTILDLKAAGAK
jgi:regulator of protease activity HflC (stomatin/prohibitin superfamily)